MANTRSTYGSLLGTITTAANAVTNTLSTLDTTIGMAATAIDDAARRQKARSKLDEHAYKRTIATEKAMELETLDQSILDWLDGDEGRTTRFNKTLAELTAVLG